MYVLRLLILIPLFIITSCMQEAYLIDKGQSIGNDSVPYDLINNIYTDESGAYRGCYVDPLARGQSQSTNFTFYQDGTDIYLELTTMLWNNGGCFFDGNLPTTLKSEYYKILGSTLTNKVIEKDSIQLRLAAMDYDGDLSMWVERGVPVEEMDIVVNTTTSSLLIQSPVDGSYEVELLIDVY